MAKKKTSQTWMAEHVSDQFVRQAKQAGYRSRASYKLMEMDDRHHWFRPGKRVVDLGAAPGGWSQVVIERILPGGKLIALDCLPMEPIDDVLFFQGDFTEQSTLDSLEAALEGKPVDVVISDMAPNISGIAAVDQAKSVGLCELALDFSLNWLSDQGVFLAKLFQGADYGAFLQQCRASFHQVQTIKPKASRDRSAEIYLIGQKPKRS